MPKFTRPSSSYRPISLNPMMCTSRESSRFRNTKSSGRLFFDSSRTVGHALAEVDIPISLRLFGAGGFLSGYGDSTPCRVARAMAVDLFCLLLRCPRPVLSRDPGCRSDGGLWRDAAASVLARSADMRRSRAPGLFHSCLNQVELSYAIRPEKMWWRARARDESGTTACGSSSGGR